MSSLKEELGRIARQLIALKEEDGSVLVQLQQVMDQQESGIGLPDEMLGEQGSITLSQEISTPAQDVTTVCVAVTVLEKYNIKVLENLRNKYIDRNDIGDLVSTLVYMKHKVTLDHDKNKSNRSKTVYKCASCGVAYIFKKKASQKNNLFLCELLPQHEPTCVPASDLFADGTKKRKATIIMKNLPTVANLLKRKTPAGRSMSFVQQVTIAASTD